MCYFNGQKITKAEYIRLKGLEKLIAEYDYLDRELVPGFDYGPSMVLVKSASGDDFDLRQMEWGFIPSYIKNHEDLQKMRMGYKDSSGKFQPPRIMLNAVGEEMLNAGKVYRDATLHRRCLVLSTGFYEWRHIFPLNKRTGQPLKTANKYPYHITVKDREYFFMAGIWQPWTDRQTGEHRESFAIVTTAANPLMQIIHNSKMRMPVIFSEEQAWDWLFKDLDEHGIRELASSQFPAEKMQAISVAKEFREATNPSASATYPGVEAIFGG